MPILNVSEIENLKWTTYYDEVIKARISYLGEFLESTNLFYNRIIIISKSKKDRFGDSRMVHEFYLGWDKWGESGIFGVSENRLNEVKKQVIQIVKEKITEGADFHF